jgi:hypothetical protein
LEQQKIELHHHYWALSNTSGHFDGDMAQERMFFFSATGATPQILTSLLEGGSGCLMQMINFDCATVCMGMGLQGMHSFKFGKTPWKMVVRWLSFFVPMLIADSCRKYNGIAPVTKLLFLRHHLGL